MFRCSSDPNKVQAMASILILGGVLPLAIALVSQYGFGLFPCHFCLLQRWPYVIVVALGVLSLLFPRGSLRWRVLVALNMYALFSTAVLGVIHTGVEQKLIEYTGGCVAQAPVDDSIEALRAAIAAAPLVSCSDATAVFAGLSMASWNVLWALFVIVLIAVQYRFERRRYEQQP